MRACPPRGFRAVSPGVATRPAAFGAKKDALHSDTRAIAARTRFPSAGPAGPPGPCPPPKKLRRQAGENFIGAFADLLAVLPLNVTEHCVTGRGNCGMRLAGAAHQPHDPPLLSSGRLVRMEVDTRFGWPGLRTARRLVPRRACPAASGASTAGSGWSAHGIPIGFRETSEPVTPGGPPREVRPHQ